MGRMEFVPRTFIDFGCNCTKVQCEYCKCGNQIYSDKPAVAGVIIGARLGIVDHISNNAQVFNFSLDKSDCDVIDAACTRSNNLFEIIGDCGDEVQMIFFPRHLYLKKNTIQYPNQRKKRI